MILAEVKAFLLASAPIAALVADRIYYESLPSGVGYPAITLDSVADLPEVYGLAGEIGPNRETIQIDVWSRADNGLWQVNRVANALRNRLSGYRGMMGAVRVTSVQLVRKTPLSETPQDGSERRTRRISMDFDFIYQVAIPTHS